MSHTATIPDASWFNQAIQSVSSAFHPSLIGDQYQRVVLVLRLCVSTLRHYSSDQLGADQPLTELYDAETLNSMIHCLVQMMVRTLAQTRLVLFSPLATVDDRVRLGILALSWFRLAWSVFGLDEIYEADKPLSMEEAAINSWLDLPLFSQTQFNNWMSTKCVKWIAKRTNDSLMNQFELLHWQPCVNSNLQSTPPPRQNQVPLVVPRQSAFSPSPPLPAPTEPALLFDTEMTPVVPSDFNS